MDILTQEAKLFDVRFFLKRALKDAKQGHGMDHTNNVVPLKTGSATDPHAIIAEFAVPASRANETGSGDANHYAAARALCAAGCPAEEAEFHLGQFRMMFGRGKDKGAAKRIVKSVYRWDRTARNRNMIGIPT